MATTAAPHTTTVLVVEPDPAVRAQVRASAPGAWRVVEVASGAEALKLAGTDGLDLVVLGLPLPDADGLEICRALERGAERRALLPVLVLTADGRDPEEAALAAGADDVLAKPLAPSELSLRLRVLERLRAHELLARDEEDALSALVAHDLRNPLSAAAGILGMLRKEATDPGMREDLDTAYAGVARARDILDDVLRARMLEVGAILPARNEADLAELTRAAARTLAGAARDQGVALVLPAGAGPRAPADEDLVRRALENLVANAIRYARRGSAVEITTGADGATAFVEVADRGPAIPDALKRAVFEKYGSVAAARGSARRGHGLALHFAWLVARLHGGTAEAVDRAGGGNVFRLVLATARPPAGDDELA